MFSVVRNAARRRLDPTGGVPFLNNALSPFLDNTVNGSRMCDGLYTASVATSFVVELLENGRRHKTVWLCPGACLNDFASGLTALWQVVIVDSTSIAEESPKESINAQGT